ncbi:hypothetical protein K502DRAFT_345516 [Neoconidiobolus thromboides FSU 785]|nr:hypothetical protein K502DRAFT_345516 [Neoconidiobolus thromboides FSU 785]
MNHRNDINKNNIKVLTIKDVKVGSSNINLKGMNVFNNHNAKLNIILGRVININDCKPHTTKDKNTYGYYQLILIKDDIDIIPIKIYSKVKSTIKLDDLVGVIQAKCKGVEMDEMVLYNPSINHPFGLSKWLEIDQILFMIGNIKILIEDNNNNKLFKKPIGYDNKLFKINYLKSVRSQIGNQKQYFDGKILLGVIMETQIIKTKYGSSNKRTIKVVDQELSTAEITLWGDLTLMANDWVVFETALLITQPNVDVFRGNIQISIGFNSFIEINPSCINNQWIRDQMNHINNNQSKLPMIYIELGQIKNIKDLKYQLITLEAHQIAKFNIKSILCCLNIDQDSNKIVYFKCDSCKNSELFKFETIVCHKCKIPFKSNNIYFWLNNVCSLIDESGMLNKLDITNEAAIKLLSCTASDYVSMGIKDRYQLKSNLLFEEFNFIIEAGCNCTISYPQLTITDIIKFK